MKQQMLTTTLLEQYDTQVIYTLNKPNFFFIVRIRQVLISLYLLAINSSLCRIRRILRSCKSSYQCTYFFFLKKWHNYLNSCNLHKFVYVLILLFFLFCNFRINLHSQNIFTICKCYLTNVTNRVISKIVSIDNVRKKIRQFHFQQLMKIMLPIFFQASSFQPYKCKHT